MYQFELNYLDREINLTKLTNFEEKMFKLKDMIS